MYSISEDTKFATNKSAPVCFLHKLLLVSSFFRAFVEINVYRSKAIALLYAPCASMDLSNWSCSAPFDELQNHYRELQRTLAFERSKEEQTCNEEEDRESNRIDFGSMSGSYSIIYKMNLVGMLLFRPFL